MKILMWTLYITFLMSLSACSIKSVYPTQEERNSHFYANENGYFRNDFGVDVQRIISAEPVDDVVEVRIINGSSATPRRGK